MQQQHTYRMNLIETFLKSVKTISKCQGLVLYIDPEEKCLKHIAGDKPTWVSSVAESYTETLKMLLNLKFNEAPTVLHVYSSFYMNNKIFVNNLIERKTPVHEDSIICKESSAVKFKGKLDMGMFMPLSRQLIMLESKLEKDPDSLLKMAQLVTRETFESCAPCHSCGTPCLLPDVDGAGGLSDEEMQAILKIANKGNCFCIDCGARSIAAVIEYKGYITNQDFSSDITALKSINTNDLSLRATDFLDTVQTALQKIARSSPIYSGQTKIKSADHKKDIPTWLN